MNAEQRLMARMRVKLEGWYGDEHLEQQAKSATAIVLKEVRAVFDLCAELKVMGVECRFCGALVGKPCWDKENNCPASGDHYTRHGDALTKAREEWEAGR